MNAKDGGKRQVILCTNNENKICEEVTYPRIKKVIEGYGEKKGIPANVKYFKTDYLLVVNDFNSTFDQMQDSSWSQHPMFCTL